MRGAPLGVGLALLLGCSSGPPRPATLDPRHEQCAFCRMAVSDPGLAAQLVAPGEEARFFDDIGCFAGYLGQQKSLPQGAVGFVADHRTRAWVRAEQAVYTRVPTLETPMASHIVAHGDAVSRDADPAASGGSPLALQAVYGPQGPPDEARGMRSAVLLFASQELTLALRSRWTQIFAVVFALLALAVATSGYILSGGHGVQDFARTAVSLVQLVLLLVPLTALVIGVTPPLVPA